MYKRNIHELSDKLNSQIRFITSSCESFDHGFDDEAQRIATSLRVIFSDTKRYKSLLTSLGIKDSTYIISSVDQYIPANMLPYSGLLQIVGEANAPSKYVPASYPYDSIPNKWLQIEDWWNEIILDDKKDIFTRKDLVLYVADQDGGAHVDVNLDESYANLAIRNSLGWVYHNSQTAFAPLDKNPAYACIRQIAFEVMFSFRIINHIENSTCQKTGDEMIFAFIEDKRYLYFIVPEQAQLMMPLFKDNRVTHREKRHIYVDDLGLTGQKRFARTIVKS